MDDEQGNDDLANQEQEQYDFDNDLDGQVEIEADALAEEAEEKLAGDEEEEHITFEDDGAQDIAEPVAEEAETNGTYKGAEANDAAPALVDDIKANDADTLANDGHSSHAGQQEWLLSDIPHDHRPLPLFRVRNIPADVSVDALCQLLINNDIKVHDVGFDDQLIAGKRIALVRMAPLPLPWASELSEEEKALLQIAQDGDVSKLAAHVVKTLQGKDLQIKNTKLALDSSQQDVTLFFANLTPDFDSDEALSKKMHSFGKVLRCFVAKNLEGKSKNYGIVEFQLPAAARKAKDWADKVEQTMRSATSNRTEGRFQQIKLMKAEWAITKTVPQLFGRVLYVANLQLYTADSALKGVFEKCGKLKDCYIPRQKGTGQGKGFAFVDFESSVDADIAFRKLNNQHQATLGTKILVSFANPAKQPNTSSNQTTTQTTAAKSQPNTNNRTQTQQSGVRHTANTAAAGSNTRNSQRAQPPSGARPPAGPPPGPAPAAGLVPAIGPGMVAPVVAPGMMAPLVAPMANPMLAAAANPMMANPMAAVMVQQAAMQQAQMQMRAQQLAMQQQMQQAQLAMQTQLQQTQAQLQLAQHKAQQYQQQATAAQLKAKQEAEARKRAEETAQRQKAAFTAFPGYGVGASGMDMATMNVTAMNAAAFGMGGYGMGAFAGQAGLSATALDAMGGGMSGQKRTADNQQSTAAAFTAQGGYGFGMQGYGGQDFNKRMRF